MDDRYKSFSPPTRSAALDEAISLDQLRMAARNHGMPSEILARDVTPIGLHYLPVHYDIPILELGKRI
jgi:sulfane dehydrogenase subunit SoxC